MADRKLNDKHRKFIVRELACYATPKQAADALYKHYGMQITRQTAECYDPTKVQSSTSQKWAELFWRTREEFLSDVDKHIPGSSKFVRLARYERIFLEFMDKGNLIAAQDTLERMAKEMGNVHTNRRELTGKEGGPLQFEDTSQMTYDQITDRINGIFANALKRQEEARKAAEQEQQAAKDGSASKKRAKRKTKAKAKRTTATKKPPAKRKPTRS